LELASRLYLCIRPQRIYPVSLVTPLTPPSSPLPPRSGVNKRRELLQQSSRDALILVDFLSLLCKDGILLARHAELPFSNPVFFLIITRASHLSLFDLFQVPPPPRFPTFPPGLLSRAPPMRGSFSASTPVPKVLFSRLASPLTSQGSEPQRNLCEGVPFYPRYCVLRFP